MTLLQSEVPRTRQPSTIGADWIARYEALVALMYEVRRTVPTLPVLGLSLVHPRHAVPPIQWQVLRDLQRVEAHRQLPSVWTVAKWWLKCLWWALRDTVHLAVLRLRWGARLRQLMREPAAVLMKTWAFGPESVREDNDFYYGTLPHALRARGISSVVLYGDGRERIDAQFMRRVLQCQTVRAAPEQLLIPLWAPLATACAQLRDSVVLRQRARSTSDVNLALVYQVASLECLGPYTTRNALYFHLARRAVRRWRARVFLTLYEGQPWEQPAWLGAKAADPRCVVAGYQHTIVMPYSRSLTAPRRDAWERSAPDVLLCLGEATRDMMHAGHAPHGTRLILFGSHRWPRDATLPRMPQPQRRAVLVIPEGILSEAQVLFTFAMQLAATLPDHRFVFRCHPLVPFEQVRPHLPMAPEQLPNVELSRRSAIHDDFARTSVVLYRGSSAVLYAVLYGLKPIYLHDDQYPDVDPLFALDGWRVAAASTAAAAETLRAYADSTHAAAEEWRAGCEYVYHYTQPTDENAVDRFLTAVGLA